MPLLFFSTPPLPSSSIVLNSVQSYIAYIRCDIVYTFQYNGSSLHCFAFHSQPVLQLVASYIVPQSVQSYIAYIRCIKIRTMVVLSIAYPPLSASDSTASSNYLHCTNIRTTCRKILLLGYGSQIYQYTPENDTKCKKISR